MKKLSKQHLINFFKTEAGGDALRKAAKVTSEQIISAAKYYMGVPDGKFIQTDLFEENAVKAKKAYVTLNTIMGGDTAEIDRFKEGKKQVPELITFLGVIKMVELYTLLYCFASGSKEEILYETVRACRQSEICEGKSIVEPLTSTTKLSVDEIMKLGYGNKNSLAICKYKFHRGAVVFDMEKLGKDYTKPNEREVLLLMGNKLISKCLGYSNKYLGRDGQPALMYEVDVYPPEFKDEGDEEAELEKVLYNFDYIEEIRNFYEKLNKEDEYPMVPACYAEWKKCFKKRVFLEISKVTPEMCLQQKVPNSIDKAKNLCDVLNYCAKRGIKKRIFIHEQYFTSWENTYRINEDLSNDVRKFVKNEPKYLNASDGSLWKVEQYNFKGTGREEGYASYGFSVEAITIDTK